MSASIQRNQNSGGKMNAQRVMRTAHATTQLAMVIAVVALIPNTRLAAQNDDGCPDEVVRIIVPPVRGSDSIVDHIPLSGPYDDIPEYNDCQRFVVLKNGTLVYDSVYAIFAAFRQRDSAGAAFVPGSMRKIPVATIYSRGGDYPRLGIQPGFNCLFLYQEGGARRAKMVPWGSSDPDCTNQAHDPNGPGTILGVSAVVTPGMGTSDYPEVSRWDFDTATNAHYIGLSCGPAWCEVGRGRSRYREPPIAVTPPDWDQVVGRQAPPQNSRLEQRVRKVKGWYDRQRLAIVVDGQLRPGPVQGILLPHPLLDELHGDPANLPRYNHNWGHVATAILDGDYKIFSRGWNKIYHCRGVDTTCARNAVRILGRGITMARLPACDATDPDDPELKWWAMVLPSSGGVHFACVRRTSHLAELTAWNSAHSGARARFVGSARWRWLETDEKIWVSCPSGCCTNK